MKHVITLLALASLTFSVMLELVRLECNPATKAAKVIRFIPSTDCN